ncbi:BAG family molecular chaperone regulator 2 [Elysia marginata]|uniref:BAG family molecular chaperone regulator 2 n=1 Tax=Elysia marginata TaxID=1093978 RepID=A0AAV4HBY0_9GAST|nr:BAG family molecular chaperone regulator 2 [Elysia marginata]
MAEKDIESKKEDFNRTGFSDDSFLLISYLDEVDDRIENLRRRAQDLHQDRESLLTVLAQIKTDCSTNSMPVDESNDLLVTIERLKKRCEAVDVKVHTVRSPEQEHALSKVQSLIEDLERICILEEVDNDGEPVRNRAQCLLNACSSDAPSNGPIDYKFQGLILGCKMEDQKLVRHRLECLVNGRCHEDFVEAHIGQSLAKAEQKPRSELEKPTSCTNGSLS